MMAETLFDAAARQSDPATSHTAAREDRTGLEQKVLDAIRWAGERGATTDEVHHRLTLAGTFVKHNSVSRRITTLASKELIEFVGTRPGDSGRQQQAWRAS